MTFYTGKTVWIIGASSGIGDAFARELNARGASLILSSRDTDALKSLNILLGGNHMVLPFDVTDKDAFAAAFQKIGRLDSTIYFPAAYIPGNIEEITQENAANTISVNLEGAFTLLRHLIPFYSKQGYGQIALCGSVAGYAGLPGGQPYSATKAAIINLAESLRAEMAGKSLDVRLISPGFVKTRLTDKNKFPMPMIITSEEAAWEIAEGLQGKKFEIHFPKKFTLLMKIIELLPYSLYFKIASWIR